MTPKANCSKPDIWLKETKTATMVTWKYLRRTVGISESQFILVKQWKELRKKYGRSLTAQEKSSEG